MLQKILDIAKLLNNKVAVITDNDHDYAVNVTNNYSDYTQDQFPNIKFHSDR